MMYNQRPNFIQLRQPVPSNMRSARQPNPNLMATSPASNMYQPSMNTTMFVTPTQQGQYMANVTGQSQVITMPGGGTIPPAQLMNMYPQHYTINTSQPAQYAVTPNQFYAPPNPVQYYQTQTAAVPPHQPLQQTQQTQPQQQQPPQQQQLSQQLSQQQALQQLPQQSQPVTQTTQPQRPGSQPANQNPYQKRERKGLAIIDPETGKDVSVAFVQPVKTATPPQLDSGSGGTPVANTPPPQQPGVAPPEKQEPEAPPQQPPISGSKIAAQFAAQVAATLKTTQGMKAGPPGQQHPAQPPPTQTLPQAPPTAGSGPAGVVIQPNVAPSAPQVPQMTTGTPEFVPGSQALSSMQPGKEILSEPTVPGSMTGSSVPSQSPEMLYLPPTPPQVAPIAVQTVQPNVNIPPLRQSAHTPQENVPQVLPTSASIPVSVVATPNQNPPPQVSQPSPVPLLSTSTTANTNKVPQSDISRQSPPKRVSPPHVDNSATEKVIVLTTATEAATVPKPAVFEALAPVEQPVVEAEPKANETALIPEKIEERVTEQQPEKVEAVKSTSVSADHEDSRTEEKVSTDVVASPIEPKATSTESSQSTSSAQKTPMADRPARTDVAPVVKDQVEEIKEETKPVVLEQDKKKNPPRQRLKETEDNAATEVPKDEEITNKMPDGWVMEIPTVPSVNIPEIIVNESKTPTAAAETREVSPTVSAPPTSATTPKESVVEKLVVKEQPPVVDIAITSGDQQTVIGGDEEGQPKEPNMEEKSEDKKEIKLKYEYKEDQWSPINMEGKKSYDRQFLLKLQYSSKSTLKPKALLDLTELVVDNPARTPPGDSYNRNPQHQMDFTPGFVRASQQNRGPSMGKNRSQQRGGGSRGGEQRKVISIQREPEVQLQKSENPYKPAYMQPKAASGEETEVDELYRKVRSILNKLTPQKFQTLMQQILDLNIDTEEKLTGVIDIIFEKAIDEPAFSVAYAKCCKIMTMQVKVASTANPKELVTFKKLLLNRCQTEFEKDKKEATDMEQMQKEIDEAESEEKKKLLTEDMNLAQAKAKRRSLGNIRFIGELFKFNMLTERIMHDCIMGLLKCNDEENLECLCRLVSTVGKSLDHEKAKQLMDQYFHRIEKIVKTKAVSSRISFMLQDLMDLRQNNWKPRRDENAPKTIEQIHKDAEDEKVEKAASGQRLAQERNQRMVSGNRGRGSMQQQQQQQDEYAWQAVVTGKTNRLDPSKMKLSKTNVDENIQLGPGSRFGGWGRGSTGGGRNASQEKERISTPGNRFSALSGGGPTNEGDSRRPMSRTVMSGGSRERGGGRLAPAQQGRQMARTSGEKDREAAIKAARNISASRGDQGRLTPGGSRNQSRENSRNRETEEIPTPKVPGTPAAPPPPPVQEMSAEILERKTKSTLDEYLSNHDLKEAVECTKEIPPHLRHKFTDISIQHVLERSDFARRMTGTLLHDLVKTGVLSVDQYLQGLKETLEFAEDMEIDIPKIWLYLGQLIGPMVQDGSVPLSFLKSACEPLLTCNKAGLLVSEVLADAVHRLGHVKVGDQWKTSGLQWSDFVDKDIDEFIKKHKLEYTLDEQQEPRSPVGKGFSDEKVQVELDRLIKERRVANEDVFDWVDTNVGESNVKKPAFIRALMTTVCSSAITGHSEKWGVNTETIKKRGALLTRYLSVHDPVLELQAIYALQALVHKLQHPQDVLRIFFDTLYDEDIISEDAFNQWDNSEDTAEQAGRGVARKSVVQFFRWLREAEEDQES